MTLPLYRRALALAVSLVLGAGMVAVAAPAAHAAPINTSLLDLAVSGGTLRPTFAAGTTEYDMTVPSTTGAVSLLPISASGTSAVVKDSNDRVGPIVHLVPGQNRVTITVTEVAPSPEPLSTTYTVNVLREHDVTLQRLTVSGGTLAPLFDANTEQYTLDVPHETTSVTVTVPLGSTHFGNVVEVRDSGNTPRNPIPLLVGANMATVTVTSPDAQQSKQYSIRINRAAAPFVDVALRGLDVSEGTLTPVFSGATTFYSVSVPYATDRITVTPGAVAAGNSVVVRNSANVVGNEIRLYPGVNSATVTVTAPGGIKSEQYTLHITRGAAPTDNVDLADIGLSAGTLSPAFDANTLNYSATVPYAVRNMQITPTAAKAGHTVTVNNVPVAAGQSATVPISFSPNGSGFGISVTAANGATKTYAVTIKRAQPSANSDITALALSNATLSPVYSSTQSSYTARVPYLTTSTTVTSSVADATAVLRVNGRDTASGVASAPVALRVGSNTITVAATAEDTQTTTTRTITIMRDAPNLDLSSLTVSSGTLSPAFDAATTGYTLALPFATSSIDVAAAAVEPNWTIAIKGSQAATQTIAVPVGASSIPVTVTAQHGETRSYTIAVTRQAASTDASLSGITLSAGTLSPAFSGVKTSYTASVSHSTESITVGAAASSSFATVAINGQAAASATVPLSSGENTIAIVTTAQSGATSTTTLLVTREAAPAAKVDIALGFAAGDTSANAPFDVVGANLRPGSTATVTMHSTPVVLATGIVGADGTIKLSARIPANAELGAHRLVFSGTAADGSAASTTAWFSALRNGTIGAVSLTGPVTYAETPTPGVTPTATPPATSTPTPAAAQPGAPAGSIASTGVDGGFALVAGLVLAALGAVLIGVRAMRRRRTAA